jgi:hypothetical protein
MVQILQIAATVAMVVAAPLAIFGWAVMEQRSTLGRR